MKSFKDTIETIEEEAIWKVSIEGLPAMYVNGKSAGEVKNQLRKLLKNPSDVIKSIDRILPTEVKKDLRLRLTGKADLEGDDDLDEAYSPMHVKQAIGIATDKRYKGGNMTGAVSAIEKLKKGLSKHPQVRAVLQRVNEAVDPTDTGGEEEVSMAMNQVKQIRHYVDGIEKMVKADGDMEEWVQNKLTKATDYLKSVYGYKTGKSDTNESYIPEGMAQTHSDIKKAMGNIKHSIVMRGKKHFVQVDQNDEKDAQAKIKNHPLYISGNLRLMPMNKESFELAELSPELKSRYGEKAKSDYGHQQFSADIAKEMGAKDSEAHYRRKQKNRMAGLNRIKK